MEPVQWKNFQRWLVVQHRHHLPRHLFNFPMKIYPHQPVFPSHKCWNNKHLLLLLLLLRRLNLGRQRNQLQAKVQLLKSRTKRRRIKRKTIKIAMMISLMKMKSIIHQSRIFIQVLVLKKSSIDLNLVCFEDFRRITKEFSCFVVCSYWWRTSGHSHRWDFEQQCSNKKEE